MQNLIMCSYINGGITKRYYSNKKLTRDQRNSFSIIPELHETIIGLSLGDLNINKEYTNARLRFEQGSVHEAYILFLFHLFKDYCNTPPRYNDRKPNIRTKKKIFNYNF